MPYNTLMCTLHVYKPTVRPVTSSILFFDLQVVTLLLSKFTLFARANLYYPTTRLRSYFSTIFAAHLRVYIHTLDVREALSLSYNPLYVHVRPGYREKPVDLQGTKSTRAIL